MKTLCLLLVLLTIVIVPFPSLVEGATPCSANTCTVTVARLITTNDWGTTFVNDTVRVDALSSVSSLTLGLPIALTGSLHHISAKDTQQRNVQVTPMVANQTGKYQPYQFAFPASVSGNYTFMVRSVFS